MSSSRYGKYTDMIGYNLKNKSFIICKAQYILVNKFNFLRELSISLWNSLILRSSEISFSLLVDVRYHDFTKNEDGSSERLLTYTLTLNYTIGPKHSETSVKQVPIVTSMLL